MVLDCSCEAETMETDSDEEESDMGGPEPLQAALNSFEEFLKTEKCVLFRVSSIVLLAEDLCLSNMKLVIKVGIQFNKIRLIFKKCSKIHIFVQFL